MPAVFEQLFGLQRTAICDRKAMELEAAREILAEVFGVGLSEVDEMIRSRFQAGENDKSLTQSKIDNFILQNVVYILWRAK